MNTPSSSPKRRCTNWLQSYMRYASDSSEAPKSFHVWTAISTMAAVLQRKVWIEENIFQWTPNFYIVFVGPAGIVTKSTTIKLGSRLLLNIDGVTFGPNSLTWNALTEGLSNAQKTLPTVPGDFESPSLTMSCLTCSVGELGTFLDPTDRKMVDVFVDLWDGQIGVWEHATKTQGTTTIENPWLNIIAATTPSWLKENFPESMIGGGLTSRIVFVYGDKKRQYVPYPHLVQTSKEHEKLEADLIHDLEIMNTLMGAYELTAEALAWGVAWYEKHWTERPEHLANERFEGYLARKQTHLHKLAIVLAASKSNRLFIDVEDLENANKMVTLLEHDMLKVFQSIGASSESKNLYTLIKILLVFGGDMKQNELYAQVQATMNVIEFNDACTAGIKSQNISLISTGGVVMVKLKAVPKDMVTSQSQN